MESKPEILFEDANFIVLNKPAGWFSVPARAPKPEDQVLTTWLREKAENEAWVVHRLDRFTSGVILYAKTPEAQKFGNEWFYSKQVKKSYLFFASPTPSMPAIQIRTPVDGKPSQTLFEVKEKKVQYFLGKATPLTGRFHQVREHARDAGFPIFGDKKLGGLTEVVTGARTLSIPRVCLHAFELTTPLGTFQAPLPNDMATLWKEIL